MSPRPPQFGVVAVAVALLTATVVPWVAVGTATTAAASGSFAKSTVYEQTGDVANITVNTNKPATVNLGSPNTNFWLQVQVSGGKTTLRLNTFKAGQSNRYGLEEMVWAASGSVKGRQLRTPSIDAPLEPAQYQMNVTVKDQEKDVGALVVEERATNDVTARIAPAKTDVAEFKTAGDMRSATVPPWNGSVARGDWALVYVNATGVKGALSKAKLDGDGGTMRVDFEQTNPPMNGRGNQFTGASIQRVFLDGNTEGFYLAVDTGAHRIEAGDRYRVEFTIPEGSDLADEKQNVSTTLRIAPRRVDIEGPRNGPLVVEDKTTIRGTTTLTPGSTINISARDADLPPFHMSQTVTVSPNRTFAVAFDFRDIEPGREFEIRLPDQKRAIPGQVKAETKPTTTRTPNTTTTEDAEPENRTTTTRTTTTETTAVGLTQVGMGETRKPLTQQASKNGSANATGGDKGGGLVPSVPGFGPVTSLLAVLAAVLLAARRR
ncbi:BGTF surface domain-containing protein [Halorussus lipolyticus]|uniref:BGTF surface domain-containing protein n=1 Tax=Halorussus lipolyticus TaxID=3034024 RepID=UPI0023E792E1|nr:BGTF surface domain-containing protein [Halorussus sp. DT80]